MAERLTRNNKVNFCFHDEASNMVYYRLQDLEDIMEKYGIESVEELEEKLNEPERIWNANLKDLKQQVKREINKELETDRDTWKRACELAVLWIAQELKVLPKNIKKSEFEFEDEMIIEENTNYFYQQAKKEGEHGN